MSSRERQSMREGIRCAWEMGSRWNEWVNGSGIEYIYYVGRFERKNIRDGKLLLLHITIGLRRMDGIGEKERDEEGNRNHEKWKFEPMWTPKAERKYKIYGYWRCDGAPNRDHFTQMRRMGSEWMAKAALECVCVYAFGMSLKAHTERMLLSTDHEILYLHLHIDVHRPCIHTTETNACGDGNNIVSSFSPRWNEETSSIWIGCVCVLCVRCKSHCGRSLLSSSFCFNAFVRPFSINDIW